MSSRPPDLYAEGKRGREQLAVGSFVAAGTFGEVFKLEGKRRGQVVKHYPNPATARESEPKIRWMAGTRPPLLSSEHQGKTYFQLAWPLELTFDKQGAFAGFTMPEIDLSASVGLEWIMEKSGRKDKKVPEDYRFRLHIARNLAALFDSLHKVGVCVIDVKPDNIQFYRETGFICLLDCDSFIPTDRNQPSVGAACTPGYILPEAKRASGTYAADEYREEQDRFALAVLIFRLMNEGLNPFTGKITDAALQKAGLEPQQRIDRGLYPYGLKPDRRVKPAFQSRHAAFADDTRKLFDRAFASRQRPTAREWADHLGSFVDAGSTRLVKCSAKPGEHVHFGKGCGFCAADKALADLASKRAKAKAAAANAAKPSPKPAAPRPAPPPVPPRPVQPASIAASIKPTPTPSFLEPWKILLSIVAVLIVVGLLIDTSGGDAVTIPGTDNETVQITPVAREWTAQVQTGRTINLRVGPGGEYGVVYALGQGIQFTTTATAEAKDGTVWNYVQLPDGTRGFVASWVATRVTGEVYEQPTAAAADAAYQPPAEETYAPPSAAPTETAASPAVPSRSRGPSNAREYPVEQFRKPIDETNPEPAVLCILPNGGEQSLSLAACRASGGTVYQ